MYNGDERLVHNGKYLSNTMLDFWKWAYSDILHNMQRGTFAEFIVKCALENIGIHTNEEQASIKPYDLNGPIILSSGKPARIEVKSAAFVQTWDIKHPDRANYSIAPAKMPDETGDYPYLSGRQRNNDIYVFTLYTATNRRENILDLSWWEFYILPTYFIESDKKLVLQKTISLKTVKKLCPVLSFEQLGDAIQECCKKIPIHEYRIFPSNT